MCVIYIYIYTHTHVAICLFVIACLDLFAFSLSNPRGILRIRKLRTSESELLGNSRNSHPCR